MLINSSTSSASSGRTAATPRPSPARPEAARTIMIVNGDDRAIHLIDAVLDAGRYDVVFVESTAHAYSRVKSLRPNLVVVCTRPGDMGGFQVLTMLKLDEDTRSIPVVTCAMEEDDEPEAEKDPATADDGLNIPVPTPAGRPN